MLNACGGGGSSSARPVPAAGMASVSVALHIPGPGSQSKKRSPQYVPANTASISLDFGNGPQNFNAGAGATGCSASAPTPTYTEFTTSSQPRGITRGPDGNIWYATDIGSAVGKITPAGVQTETSLGGAIYSDNSITFGTDGMLYVPLLFQTYAPEINPSNSSIAGYANLPYAPVSVAAGYDNAVWFIRWQGGNDIMRVATPGGAENTFTPTTPPGSLAAGPDNAMWFAESGPNMLGRVTFSGGVFSYTAVPVPVANAGVGDVTLGPDGQLWFFEYNLGRIGRYNTATQTFSEIAVPAGPLGSMTLGLDNAMYYSGGSPPSLYIGRVTSSGQATTYPYTNSHGNGPYILATGSDGAIYFTDDGVPVGIVGRMSINAASGTTCTFSPAAPVGTDTVVVKTYDQTGGSAGGGHVLSATSVKTVVSNGTNTLSFTLGGVTNNVTVSFSPTGVSLGTPQAVAVTVQVTDPSGNIIVGPATYSDASGNPLTIALASSDTTGNTTLSTTSVTSPATLVTLSYNGSSISPVTLTPSVTGGSASGTVSPGTLTYSIP